MFRNYLKIAIRNLLKNKSVSAIHILGLSIGIAACLIIVAFLNFEKSFDKHHSNYERIYRLVTDDTSENITEKGTTTPYPTPLALHTDFTDLEAVAGLHLEDERMIQTAAKDFFSVEDIVFADPDFLNIFDVHWKNGKTDLKQPGQIVLDESTARLLFKDGSAIGQKVTLNGSLDLEVAAVMHDWPKSSHLPCHILIPYKSLTSEYIGGFELDNWGSTIGGRTYFLGPKNLDKVAFNNRLRKFEEKYIRNGSNAGSYSFHVQSLKEAHFATEYADELDAPVMSENILWIFTVIGLLILLIAAINYLNLTTARGILRSHEIGIRKVIGAERSHLVSQFLGETFMLTFIAGLFGFVLAYIALPSFNLWFDRALILPFSLSFIGKYCLFLLFLTLLAGFYPALILSGFQPKSMLNTGRTVGGGKTLKLRQALVVLQFTVAISFVAGVLIFKNQLDFLKNKDLGFNKESTLVINLQTPGENEVFRQNLLKNPDVSSVSFGLSSPTGNASFSSTVWVPNTETNYQAQIKLGDFHYQKTYGIRQVAGRWFTKEETKRADHTLPREEQEYKMLVNEKMCKTLGYASATEAVGTLLKVGINNIEAEIIGVVEDFHTSSLYEELQPAVLFNFSFFYYSAGVRLKKGFGQNTIREIETAYAAAYPNSSMDYDFLDEYVNQLYANEDKLFRLIQLFAGLAIFLACLGLVGLSAFSVQQRTKEIGIRKVLGASVSNILSILSLDFLKLVGIALVFSIPLAWYAMDAWLQNFAYHTNIAWWVFAVAGVSALVLTALTVWFHAMRAAVQNPVDSLME